MRRSRAAFTLIELLTVIGIISVLLALMVPSLRQARSRAQSMKCRANMRVLQMCAALHAMDHNQRMLLCAGQWYYWYPSGPDTRGRCRFIRPDLNMAEQVQLQPYILSVSGPEGGPFTRREAQVETAATCPTAASWGPIWEVINPAYSINAYATVSPLRMMADGTPDTSQMIGSWNNLVRPSETMLFIDATMGVLNLSAHGRPNEWLANPSVAIGNILRHDTQYRYRHEGRSGHGGQTNIVYMDGHVSSMTEAEVNAGPRGRINHPFWGVRTW